MCGAPRLTGESRFCLKLPAELTLIATELFAHLPTVTVCLTSGLGVVVAREIDFHCSAGDEYLYATPGTQCTGYYKCQRHQVIKYQCEQGGYFNYFYQSCVRTEGELRATNDQISIANRSLSIRRRLLRIGVLGEARALRGHNALLPAVVRVRERRV